MRSTKGSSVSRFARDSFTAYRPLSVSLEVEDELGNLFTGNTVTLPLNTREVSIRAVLTGGGGFPPPPVEPTLQRVRWQRFVTLGGVSANLIAGSELSTKLRVLNPGDHIVVQVSIETQFETAVADITIISPEVT